MRVGLHPDYSPRTWGRDTPQWILLSYSRYDAGLKVEFSNHEEFFFFFFLIIIYIFLK